jgi:hypothetical protein
MLFLQRPFTLYQKSLRERLPGNRVQTRPEERRKRDHKPPTVWGKREFYLDRLRSMTTTPPITATTTTPMIEKKTV